MKFAEMCRELFKDRSKVAYNDDYPELLTTVRMCDKGTAGWVMYYYLGNAPNVPVVITEEVFESEGWEVIDDYTDRLNIQDFMRMPHAKEFIKELNTTINSEWNGRFTREFALKDGYQMRMREAIELGLIFANKRSGRLYFTDIGEDLIKTL